MRNYRPIVSLTLAEISLLLAFSFAILFSHSENKVTSLDEIRKNNAYKTVQMDILKRLISRKEQTIEELQRDIEENNSVITKYKDRFGGLSNIPPPCEGKGGSLFNVWVLSPNHFHVDGVTYDFNGLVEKYRVQNKIFETGGCKVRIIAHVGPAISARDFTLGINRLKGEYYYILLK